MLDTLHVINPKTVYNNVVLGSLVKTTSNHFFIAISMGKIELDDADYFSISLGSPIGQLLKNKVVGDVIVFNNNTFTIDRKSTRLNSSHVKISYAVFCLKKKKTIET